MDGLKEIKDKITETAADQAKTLIDQAQAYADSQMAQAQEEADKILDQARQQAEDWKQKAHSRSQALAEAEQRKAQLNLKQQAIDGLISQALGALVEKSQGEKLDLYTKIVQHAGIEEAKIIANPKDKDVVDQLIKKLGPSFVLGPGDASITGGLILEVGEVRHNYTYDLAVRYLKRDLDKLAADLLFSQGG